MLRLFRKRKKMLFSSSDVPALAAESRRPMVEVALPVRREPPLTPSPPVDLEEPPIFSLLEVSPPASPVATTPTSSVSVPAAVSAAPFPVPLAEEEEEEPQRSAHLSLLVDAPHNPRRREVIEFLSRAADEIPTEVEKVLRFWLESNT